ncbi:hypothetical protein AB2L38_08235 [Staphylococcus pseudintermedius]|uniref:hypothetical protein n=1 Tax=Staphylococcus pseudintermedius TaxID=283734 RepID=UPI003F952A17
MLETIKAIAEIVFYAVSTLAIVKTLIKDDSKQDNARKGLSTLILTLNYYENNLRYLNFNHLA